MLEIYMRMQTGDIVGLEEKLEDLADLSGVGNYERIEAIANYFQAYASWNYFRVVIYCSSLMCF